MLNGKVHIVVAGGQNIGSDGTLELDGINSVEILDISLPCQKWTKGNSNIIYQLGTYDFKLSEL